MPVLECVLVNTLGFTFANACTAYPNIVLLLMTPFDNAGILIAVQNNTSDCKQLLRKEIV